jgi:hypothetical protein
MILTAAIVVSFFVWNYAPVLIPFGVIAAGFGVLTLGIRLVVSRFDRRQPPTDD